MADIAPFDLEAALASVQALPARERLLELLLLAGCRSDPLCPRVIVEPAVRLVSIGGLPLAKLAEGGLAPKDAAEMAEASMGCAGALSYLALPGGCARGAYRKIAIEHGHASVAHAVSVSVFVAGATCAVENEFNSQRDLVHLARITEARSACQDAPPLVCPGPAFADACRSALEFSDSLVAALPLGRPPTPDEREAANLLRPANKATAFLVTGSLRNFQKLFAAVDEPGKEAEFRKLLSLARGCLRALWPELFPLKDAP